MAKNLARWFCLSLFFVLLSNPALAYRVRCNSKQTLCEVKTKRLTIGDHVGIFSEDGLLVAIGVINEIKDLARYFEIKKRYSPIYRSHSARRIEDREAKDPERFFTIQKPLDESLLGVSFDLVSMGVGDGFVGFDLSGHYSWLWQDQIYWVGKLNYLSASGEASDNLKNVTSQKVDLTTIGLTGGILKTFSPYSAIGFHGGLDIGFGSTSIAVGSGYDAADLLNDRVKPGIGYMIRGNISLVWQELSYFPRLGVTFLRLQNSNSFALSISLLNPID